MSSTHQDMLVAPRASALSRMRSVATGERSDAVTSGKPSATSSKGRLELPFPRMRMRSVGRISRWMSWRNEA